jgi:hypothetical protein
MVGIKGQKALNQVIDWSIVTEKEVTKQLVFDDLCNVNAKFILRV